MYQRTIQVIEDDQPTCRALQRLLERDGLVVRCAHTIAEGLESMARQWPDFVLLDLTLPDGDAAGVIDLIRGQGKATKIAVLTAAADRPSLDRQHLPHADNIFIKPMTAEPLLNWIRLHLPDSTWSGGVHRP